MIREDTGYDADMSTLVPFEHEKKEKRKPARESTNSSKRARQSLNSKWPNTQAPLYPSSDSLLLSPETPSKSLIGDTSILFSPPSVIKETLGGRSIEEAFEQPKSSKTKHLKPSKKSIKRIQFTEAPTKAVGAQLNKKFEKVACGKTDDQLAMTEMARKFVTLMRPRSLKL